MVRKRPFKAPRLSESGRIRPPSDGTGSTQSAVVCLGFEHFLADSMAECDHNHLRLWADLLRRLSSSTWQTVTSASREKLGGEKIPRHQLLSIITANLPADIEFLLSFRCSHTMRMIGFRSRERLELRWLDPKHEAY